MKEVRYYKTLSGHEPFRDWVFDLPLPTQLRIFEYIRRVAAGGSGKNIKPVGSGVFEIKIGFGPGYRVYFGEQGREIILLLLGGDKSTQPKDIRLAQFYWRHHVSK